MLPEQPKSPRRRALVVDDEPFLRKMIVAALTEEGFYCETAANGEDAWHRIRDSKTKYQLVITDLSMPQRHGHSLAVELLALPERPLVVILTGVLEPRLAKDLMLRGVDDILFKPVNFATFAAKMRGLFDRRHNAPDVPAEGPAGGLVRISQEEFDQRVRSLTRIPPISQTAIGVYKMTSGPDPDLQRVAAAVLGDPALITETLRLANSAFFNPAATRISDVAQAVSRLGLKRLGELALSTAAFSTFSQDAVPLFPLGRVWRKSLAAGIALEMLLDQTGEKGDLGGLFCAAVIQPMGRVMLASVFPRIYRQMGDECRKTGKSLYELESQIFPLNVGEVTAQVLAAWGIPEDIHRPIRLAALPYRALGLLGDPERRRAEILKTADFIGQLVVGEFEPWDYIDIPSAALLKRLGIQSIELLLRQCGDDLRENSAVAGDVPLSPVRRSKTSSKAERTVAYKRLHCDSIDFIPQILAAGGVRVVTAAENVANEGGAVLVNALGASVEALAASAPGSATREVTIFTEVENAKRAAGLGRVIAVPCSYAVLGSFSAEAATFKAVPLLTTEGSATVDAYA